MANLEYSDGAWAAVEDGIFFSVDDLPGTMASELADAVSTAAKQGQFLFSFLKNLQSQLSTTSYLTNQDAANYLGLTANKTEAIPQVGRKNHTFTFTTQWVGDKDNESFNLLPLATTGTFTDGGKLVINDGAGGGFFPNAAKVAAAANTPGAGVLIPSSELGNFGIASHASIDLAADCRMLIQAILNWLKDSEISLRTASVASAVTAVSRSTANLALPATAFDATNPTTGLGGTADVNANLYMGSSETFSFTVQNSESLEEENSMVVETT